MLFQVTSNLIVREYCNFKVPLPRPLWLIRNFWAAIKQPILSFRRRRRLIGIQPLPEIHRRTCRKLISDFFAILFPKFFLKNYTYSLTSLFLLSRMYDTFEYPLKSFVPRVPPWSIPMAISFQFCDFTRILQIYARRCNQLESLQGNKCQIIFYRFLYLG